MRPVFLVGCPRSGTSVTKKIVRRHSGLSACGVEHHYILELADHFGPSTFEFADGLSVFARSSGSFGDNFVREAKSTIEADERFDVAGFCTAIWRIATEDDGAKPILLQYAGAGLLRSEEILELFPAARFIVLTRDPRANVSSQLLSLARGRTTNRSVKLWKECRVAAEALFRKSPGQSLDVPYEALVQDPESWLKNIVSFLGLPWEERLLEFNVPMAITRTDGTPQWTSFTELDSAMLDKWRDVLSPWQIALIERRCAEEMARLGYEREGRSLRPGDVRFLGSDLARWGFAKLRASVARD